MTNPRKHKITFTRLSEISKNEAIEHMPDPRLAKHMPLLTFERTSDAEDKFIANKEEFWTRDGLGHWAILYDGGYIGWGGFQKEGDE